MKGGKEHRPSPLTAIGSSACAAEVCYQVTSPLHKYLGGLGVEPPKEKEAKKNGNLMKKKLEIKDGISLPPQARSPAPPARCSNIMLTQTNTPKPSTVCRTLCGVTEGFDCGQGLSS